MGSIFSGVGGFDLGFEAAGFRVAWQIEIDRDAVSVLERHWPDVPRHGDVRSVDPSTLAPVDVVVFGSPCQDFSVAGKRAGLAGERSGLFGEATRIIAGLRPTPTFLCWENVPGALSSAGGRDFGAALDALADLGALDVAWRVLDARHWGVPQRRRRVFVVADLGGERAASILFEPEGGSGHPASSGAAGQGAAGDAADGAGVAGVPDVGFTLRHNTNGSGSSDNAWNTTYIPATRDAADGAGVAGEPIAYGCHGNNPTSVAASLTRRYGKGPNTTLDDGALVVSGGDSPSWIPCGACGTFWCRMHDEHAHDCPCPPIQEWDDVDPYTGRAVVANTLAGASGPRGYSGDRGDASANLIAFHLTQDPISGAESRALGAGNASGCSTIAVAISENQRAEVRETPYARQVTAGGGRAGQGYPAIREGMAVRRLTPVECERLMGWGDDHTRYRANGDEISDGPRYRCIGNGVVAPVAAWIAARIAEVL